MKKKIRVVLMVLVVLSLSVGISVLATGSHDPYECQHCETGMKLFQYDYNSTSSLMTCYEHEDCQFYYNLHNNKFRCNYGNCLDYDTQTIVTGEVHSNP